MPSYIGIDVGTGSARAGVFDTDGRLLATRACAITTYRPEPDFAQQSSAEIWAAVTTAVRAALEAAGVTGGEIRGIGFDATCSLVVSDATEAPVSIDRKGAADQDVILWMDHRAIADAEAINAIGGLPLKHVGGTISPEMELPKLRWLKREMPRAWSRAESVRDLPDWLVHRASGGDVRSLCSTVCKWTYLGHKGLNGEGWDDDFLRAIGLEDLVAPGYPAIGAKLAAPGTPCGGVSDRAAAELGVPAGTPVAASLIDAYAGALGTLAVARAPDDPISARLAVIAGTSTCHIAVSGDPVFVPGVWGPYYGVMLPDLWALEGGQSAAGALLDAVIARHSASGALAETAGTRGVRVTDLLDDLLAGMAGETAMLTAGRHVQPDFHGNRSPLAQPWRKGAITGLTLDTGAEDLALDYLATLQALAYGTRHIIEEMRAAGAPVDTLVVSGGLARNTLFLRENADATGCRVIVPDQPEPVLLGCAMLAAVAAGDRPDLETAMSDMCGGGTVVSPRGGAVREYHDRKYRVFRQMQDDFARYTRLMEEDQ
ncbi:FGGY-family carbohydrate kinase [Marinibacterium profundimaris]|uniref:Ribulokinase n=1 Tax=Marinibacterium profundimaris TaxID=1679460 RepID=A0A225NKF2_9RHOB|nr:FGGY-family carbohydrate kinase [Marinibacterium profundimaris]OWU69901.1 ribulokinase [Marinibacterium profundimaris]